MTRTLVALALVLALGAEAARALADDHPAAAQSIEEVLYDVDGSVRPAHIAQFDANCANLSERYPFSKWYGSFQVMGGYYQKTGLGPNGPQFDYVPLALRLGCVCNTPCWDDCCLRGCYEVLLETNFCPIVKSFGSYVTGPNLIVRYNFVQPTWVVIPYLQAGAGMAFTDASNTPRLYQALIGQEVEFLLRAEVGARVMYTENVSLDAEVGVQHISNAGLGRHNGGVNNLGFSLGLTWFFGKLH